MALAPINPTQLTPPRVALIDERSGAISREWYRFFLSLLTATQNNQEETELAPDTAALLASYDAMLASVAQASETASDGMVTSLESSLNSLQNAFGVTPPDLGGTVTSVAASGGATGLTFTGSPITTSGTLTLGGTLAVASGGTGQTSYTDGQLLIGNTTGNTLTKATLIAGTNISITNGAGSITIASTAGTGTVTSVSVVSANGFAGTVATATTTPAITISTSVTGLIKGNGTALSAASAGTDYVAPGAITGSGLTMATARLLGRTTASTGAVEEISVAGGLTLSGGVLTGASGTVTSVTGTSPVVSSGGTTPAISMPAATASVNGYLTSTDWNTFNNKGSGTVTSVSGTGTVNGITLTGTVTSSGSLTLGGTLSGVSLTTQVSGTLPIANGGTNGTSTPTAGAVPYGTGTAYAFTVAGTSGQVLTSAGAGVPTWTTPTTGTVTSVSGTGTVNGITLTGTVTSTGSLTLGGTLSGVSLTTQVSGTLPVANGGTGATTLTAGYILKGNGGSAISASIIYEASSVIGIGTTGAYGGKLNVVPGTTPTTVAGANQIQIGEASSNTAYRLQVGYFNNGASGYNGSIQVYDAGAAQSLILNGDGGSVGVNTSTPSASAALDVQSTTKGLRLPNMTTAQKNAIGSPAAGLMVFDTTLAKACVYSGAAWQTITSI